MYLLDTNVISELRKVKTGKIDRHVNTWIKSVSSTSLYLSAISILELKIGVLLVERRDPKQGALLNRWLEDHVMQAFAGRILNIDTAVSLRCAELHVPNPRSDRDSLIAATALIHGMTVVTRNITDFVPTGVKIVNPWHN